MMRKSAFPLLFCLAACGGWPDVPAGAGQGQKGPWPELLPISNIIAPTADTAAGEADALLLAGRAAALRQRAALLRSPVDGSDDFEALRARIAG